MLVVCQKACFTRLYNVRKDVYVRYVTLHLFKHLQSIPSTLLQAFHNEVEATITFTIYIFCYAWRPHSRRVVTSGQFSGCPCRERT